MKRTFPGWLVVLMLVAGCTDEPRLPAEAPSPSPATESPMGDVAREIEIYSAVIRRPVTKDHTFGGGPAPFRYVYVVNGPIKNAGDPLGDHFGPATEPFSSTAVDGMEQQLRDLPPLRFILDGNNARRGKQGQGGVKNDGVIISLGPIERKKGRVHVATGLWCNGLCGQWLTYVLKPRGDNWRITGTTGPYAIS